MVRIYIPDLKWRLMAEIDVKEALAPLKKVKTALVCILIIVPLAVWIIGIYVSNLISNPIYKLQTGTEIIGRGNLDYRVGTDAKDEIGYLSRSFDNMTMDLKKTTT